MSSPPSPSPRASRGAVGIAAVLSFLILLFWAIALSLLADLRGSDAAGNAYAQAYAAFALIILWFLLAVLGLVAWANGNMSMPGGIAALVLIPASGVAAFAAQGLLTYPHLPPFLWPIVAPAAAPPLIVAFCFWALLPATHRYLPARAAVGIAWGGVLIACLAILPLQSVRESAREQIAAVDRKYADDFAVLPPDAPMWAITPFLNAPNQILAGEALDRIRPSPRRQADAETMLERGDFPLGYLGRFDLNPTPAICEGARGQLRRRAEALVLKRGESKSYDVIAQDVSDAVTAISWLIDYDCPAGPEAAVWEAMAKGYSGPNYDVYHLAELRDTKQLGRALREDPARFEMLTPRAHLKAWLKFTDDERVRERALAGARALDHRNADAVEMLQKDALGGGRLMEYLPALDLEPTPAFCRAALSALHKEFAAIYRPKPDDPRSYQELQGRLGRGEQFRALQWLASNGCDAGPELAEAESLIVAYKPSPESALMLYRLQQSHRKQ
jgi:hypothetical protein